MNNIITLDIETLPSDDATMLDRLRLEVRPPANYKKADIIAAWIANEGEAAAQEQFAKTGLDGLYGRICVVGYAIGEGDIAALRVDAYDSEAVFLERVFASIDNDATDEHGFVKPLEVVGHNVEFDLKFLFHRAVRYGIKLPKCIAKAFGPDAKYATHDTMAMWCRYRERVSLRNLARELLKDPCTDVDGSKVAEAWAHDPAMVVEHCISDVARTRRIYRKMVEVMP